MICPVLPALPVPMGARCRGGENPEAPGCTLNATGLKRQLCSRSRPDSPDTDPVGQYRLPGCRAPAGDRRAGAYDRWTVACVGRERSAVIRRSSICASLDGAVGGGSFGGDTGSREGSLFETFSPANPSAHVTVWPVLE